MGGPYAAAQPPNGKDLHSVRGLPPLLHREQKVRLKFLFFYAIQEQKRKLPKVKLLHTGALTTPIGRIVLREILRIRREQLRILPPAEPGG